MRCYNAAMSEDDRTVADIEGSWVDPEFASGLTERCKRNWTTPIRRLSDLMLATFIRQRLGLPAVAIEATRRLSTGHPDDTELFDGELAEALSDLDREKGAN
jgi:hypothetical protein